MKTSSIGSVKQTYKFLASIYDLIYGQTLQNGREALGVQLAAEFFGAIRTIYLCRAQWTFKFFRFEWNFSDWTWT